MEREAAIAYVTEDLEDDRLGPIAAGRFQVCLQTWPGEDAWQMLEGSWPLDQALARARERAARVVVQPAGFGTGRYTAGDAPVDDPPISEAPPLRRRRMPGWEFVDRTADDAPISWDVVIEAIPKRVAVGSKHVPADPRMGRECLAALADAAADVVSLRSDWPDDPAGDLSVQPPGSLILVHRPAFLVAVLRVGARTVEQAITAADRAVGEVQATVAESAPWRLRAVDAYPTDSPAARANAHLSQNAVGKAWAERFGS